MAALDADFAVTLVLSVTAIGVGLCVALVVAMLLLIRKDPASLMDTDWTQPREQ